MNFEFQVDKQTVYHPTLLFVVDTLRSAEFQQPPAKLR